MKLHVVDADGNEGRASRSLGIGVVVSGNPAVQCAVSMGTVQTGQPVAFSASGSDPAGMSLTYGWTFSDSMTGAGSTVQRTFASPGMVTGAVVATATDGRASMPCSKTVTVTARQSYTGTWIISPTGGSFTGTCPFTVSFPTASLSVFHTANPDGGADLLVVTPNGGSYPAGYPLGGTEELPGTFLVSATTAHESPATCGQALSTQHSIRLTFSSGTSVSGSWTKVYNGCTSGCLSCNCVAGGATAGQFTGFKQ